MTAGHHRAGRSGPESPARLAGASQLWAGSLAPTLSVVVVTRNEADRVAACLDSVLAACRDGPPFEVILVDSNSTDRTVDIAVGYPVTVLQLTDEASVTPAAGRFVGSRAAAGDRILFVDGDMVLEPGWLPRALEAIEAPAVAGVDGYLNEVDPDTDDHDVDAVRGVALYDAPALECVDGFDPFLRSVEDIDVGFRLRQAGYRLRRLAVVAASHPTSTSLDEPFRRWRNGYPFGPGQAVRRSLTRPGLLGRHLRRIRYKLLAGGWLLLGAVALLSGPLVGAWLAISVVGFAALAYRRGLRGGLQYALSTGLGVVGLVPGFAMPVRPRSAFPMETVRLVKHGPPARPDRLVDDRIR